MGPAAVLAAGTISSQLHSAIGSKNFVHQQERRHKCLKQCQDQNARLGMRVAKLVPHMLSPHYVHFA